MQNISVHITGCMRVDLYFKFYFFKIRNEHLYFTFFDLRYINYEMSRCLETLIESNY